MMMTAVLKIVARMSNAHVAQTETTPKSALDRRPVPAATRNRDGHLFARAFLERGQCTTDMPARPIAR